MSSSCESQLSLLCSLGANLLLSGCFLAMAFNTNAENEFSMNSVTSSNEENDLLRLIQYLLGHKVWLLVILIFLQIVPLLLALLATIFIHRRAHLSVLPLLFGLPINLMLNALALIYAYLKTSSFLLAAVVTVTLLVVIGLHSWWAALGLYTKRMVYLHSQTTVLSSAAGAAEHPGVGGGSDGLIHMPSPPPVKYQLIPSKSKE